MGGGGGGHPAPPHPFILQNCVVRYIGKFVISGVCFTETQLYVIFHCWGGGGGGKGKGKG